MSYSDRLSGYVDVKTRLRQALEKHPDLRVHEHPPIFKELPTGLVVICQVSVTVGDRGVNAHNSEPVPGKTPYTKDSELANGYTSALGRALGYLGFGIDESIASRDDIENRSSDPAPNRDLRGIPKPASDPQKYKIRTLRGQKGLGPAGKSYYDQLSAAEAHKTIEELLAMPDVEVER
jgi:hypothetical protein